MGLIRGPGSEALKPPWLRVDAPHRGVSPGASGGVGFNSSQICFLKRSEGSPVTLLKPPQSDPGLRQEQGRVVLTAPHVLRRAGGAQRLRDGPGGLVRKGPVKRATAYCVIRC